MKLLNIIRITAVLFIIFVATLLLLDRWVSAQTESRTYHDPAKLPSYNVGLVLGTSNISLKRLIPTMPIVCLLLSTYIKNTK